MSYKIVIDSCGELPENLKKDEHYENVSLSLQVDDHFYVDDETFDQADFLKRVAESPNVPKSTCPSPERYMKSYMTEAEHVYVITLSSPLSGSYNSAVLGKNLYIEENGEKQIHIIDSRSASVGQTLIGMKIQECEEAGKNFEEVVEIAEAYRDEMTTFFVLETLETLRKNGRLSNLKAFVASALNIKPVMGSTVEGTICQLDQARGMNKALDKMVTQILAKTKNCEQKVLGISHCNCAERAQLVKKKIEELGKFKDIFVVNTAGVSTMYANQGGIIVAV